MANRQTTASARDHKGSEVTLQQNETDSPILPVAQLERLQAFRPDAVDLVLRQTEVEATHRRQQTSRINIFVLIERITGQIFALCIGLGGIGGGVYAAVNGQPWAGATIATAAIGSLAVAFITGRKAK